MSKVLVLPDLHIPYTDMNLLKIVYEFAKKYKPDIVIQLGDMFDYYNLSSYIKSTKADSPITEINKSRQQVKELAKLFPKMQVLIGNHENRLARKAADAGIDSEFIKSIMEVAGAPKSWKYIDDPNHLEIDDVIYTHGFLSKPKAHAEWFNKSVVHGHLHQHMGIEYITRKDQTIFNMCTGLLAEIDSLVFRYGPMKKYNKFCLGFGTVTNGVPQLYPLTDIKKIRTFIKKMK